MKKTLLTPTLALLGATILPCATHAQTMDNGTMNNGTMQTGMMQRSMTTSDADRQFLIETAQGSVYDRATAELAVQKAQSKTVQRYALRLLDDHNRLNKMLLMQMNTRGIVAPLTLSDDDKPKLQNLMDVQAGTDFDTAYLREAMQINAGDIRKGNEAINNSSDDAFRRLMRSYVKTEQNHLNSASAILSSLQKQMGMMNPGMMAAPMGK